MNLIFSAKLLNIPITLTQPSGDGFSCFTSGDEYYHRLHDLDGFTIIQSKDDGYYYYAVSEINQIVPSQYLVNTIDPNAVGLIKNLRISSSEYYQRKNIYWEDVDDRDAPSIGTLNNGSL